MLLSAVYGLLNSTAKSQVQCDYAILSIGLFQSKYIPQLFYKTNNYRIVLLVSKLVDELMVSGEPEETDSFVRKLFNLFKLGSFAHGSGRIQLFGLTVNLNEDLSSHIYGDDKLNSLESYRLPKMSTR